MKSELFFVLLVLCILSGIVLAHAQSSNIVAVESISNTCDNEYLNDAGGDMLGPYNNSMLAEKLSRDSIKMERDQEVVADDRSHVQAELIGINGIAQCEANQVNGT